jgi:hypothetical protein
MPRVITLGFGMPWRGRGGDDVRELKRWSVSARDSVFDTRVRMVLNESVQS